MFCKHEWKRLSETITESKFEHAMKQLADRAKGNANIPWQMCDAERKVIQIFTCEKCGKIKKFVETI